MKIIYVLKKGLQCYPPCLAQILLLSDCGVELTVYHGKDTDYINEILEKRHIEHYILKSDEFSNNRFKSAINLLKYNREIKKILKSINSDELVWFGNCESAMMLGKALNNIKFVFTCLELYDRYSFYDKYIKRMIKKASAIICCEKHRAAIMKSMYNLVDLPVIMPNKPYIINNKKSIYDVVDKDVAEILKNKYVVLYQGILTSDRPLDKIASAIKNLNDDNIYFVVMGRCDENYRKYLSKFYDKIIFIGFIPNPDHLLVTQYADIGVANYDESCINNIFCAPNKIFEYAQFAVPMLTSTNLGLIETVGKFKAAECVNFNSIEEISRGLKIIVANHDSYSNNAVEFNNSVDNSLMIKEVLEKLMVSHDK